MAVLPRCAFVRKGPRVQHAHVVYWIEAINDCVGRLSSSKLGLYNIGNVFEETVIFSLTLASIDALFVKEIADVSI